MRARPLRSILSSYLFIMAVNSPLEGTAAETALPRVPEGFTVEKVAGSPLVQHPMLAGFDDRGRLFVAESAGRNLKAADLLTELPNFIRLLEDTNGDGRFDKSTIFADKMTLPMGALWHRGALYVASPPNIWRLEDTDGDGVADKREVLVSTFGFSGNAADIHGCFLGPTGRIYWCDGRHGHEFLDADGRIISKGKAARIFSCKPDGSDVEVFCGGGMDNPVEIDFTPEGEMLGTVNILIGRPRVDCLMHWVQGGVYPREDQEDCIAEFKRTGDLLPPMSRLGHVAVSGLTRYRSGQFGEEYRDNLFTAIFNTHKVVRSVVTRSGATFETREEDFFVSDSPDSHPTDVLEDADGSLLVIDTGGWFRIGCPTSQVAKPELHGAIYRIRRKDMPVVNDPRGLALGLDRMKPAELVTFLDDPRPAVQEQAIDRLALRGGEAIPVLAKILERRRADGGENVGRTILSADATKPAAKSDRIVRPTSQHRSNTARRNAVWALSRVNDAAAVVAVTEALSDESESVRIAAAFALEMFLKERHDERAVQRLAEVVVRDTPPVRRNAAQALGRIGARDQGLSVDFNPRAASGSPPTVSNIVIRNKAVRALFESLRVGATDRILEHALIYALIRIADREETIHYLGDPNPQVRRAALIALDQMDGGNLTRELVAPLLDTDDPALQQEALAVISRREGWAAEMLVLLREWLTLPELDPGRASVVRGVLLAQSREPSIQQLVAESLNQADLASSVALLLLEVMYRAPLELFPESWHTPLGRALDDGSSAAQLQAVQIIQAARLAQFDARLEPLARDVQAPDELRVEALIALAPRLKSLNQSDFNFAVGRLAEDVPPLLRLSAARALADLPLNDEQLLQLAGRLDNAGPLALPVLLRAFSRTKNEKVGLSLVAALNRSPAADNLSPEELAGLLREFPSRVQSEAAGLLRRLGVDPEQQRLRLEDLSALLTGGDAERGRSVFFGKKAACSGCHVMAGQGGKVGPDLTQIAAIRTGRDLLEAVVFPSASFARGYRSYIIVTDQGKVHTGVISRQTSDTVYLRTAELAEIRLPRQSIEEMKESPTSIMPKGLEKTLSAGELRDLLTYLQQKPK